MSVLQVNTAVPLVSLKGRKYRGFGQEGTDIRERYVRENGGEGGIRTLGTVRYTHFPGVLFRPLRHLSKFRGSTLHKARLKRKTLFFYLFLALNR